MYPMRSWNRVNRFVIATALLADQLDPALVTGKSGHRKDLDHSPRSIDIFCRDGG